MFESFNIDKYRIEYDNNYFTGSCLKILIRGRLSRDENLAYIKSILADEIKEGKLNIKRRKK